MIFLITFLAASLRAEDRVFVSLSKEFLDLLNNETYYNKYATPTQSESESVVVFVYLLSGIATNVSLSMFIEGISSFSAQTMDFQLDIYFQQVGPTKHQGNSKDKRRFCWFSSIRETEAK